MMKNDVAEFYNLYPFSEIHFLDAIPFSMIL